MGTNWLVAPHQYWCFSAMIIRVTCNLLIRRWCMQKASMHDCMRVRANILHFKAASCYCASNGKWFCNLLAQLYVWHAMTVYVRVFRWIDSSTLIFSAWCYIVENWRTYKILSRVGGSDMDSAHSFYQYLIDCTHLRLDFILFQRYFQFTSVFCSTFLWFSSLCDYFVEHLKSFCLFV